MTPEQAMAQYIALMTEYRPLVIALVGFGVAFRIGEWVVSLFRSASKSADY